MPSRWTACRSFCARSEFPRSQSINRLAQAITARNADWVASYDKPIAHSARVPLVPRMKVAVYSPDCSW